MDVDIMKNHVNIHVYFLYFLDTHSLTLPWVYSPTPYVPHQNMIRGTRLRRSRLESSWWAGNDSFSPSSLLCNFQSINTYLCSNKTKGEIVGSSLMEISIFCQIKMADNHISEQTYGFFNLRSDFHDRVIMYCSKSNDRRSSHLLDFSPNHCF